MVYARKVGVVAIFGEHQKAYSNSLAAVRAYDFACDTFRMIAHCLGV
jgi:hypothetical protein